VNFHKNTNLHKQGIIHSLQYNLIASTLDETLMIVEGLQLFRLEIKMKLPSGVYAAAQQARSGCNPGADELSRARFFSRGRGLTFGHPLPPTPTFLTDVLPRDVVTRGR
jgi:hypothetical protein